MNIVHIVEQVLRTKLKLCSRNNAGWEQHINNNQIIIPVTKQPQHISSFISDFF